MSLSSVCIYSRFIFALEHNGYAGTLSTLLRDLNLDKFACDISDIVTLLCANKISNELINKIGAETAIIICDELRAPYIVDAILEKPIMLNKLSEHQIINYRNQQNCINVCNCGYRIIVSDKGDVSYDHYSESLINNAYNNGLYTPHVYSYNDNIIQITPLVLNDIRKISHTRLKKFASCKNIETIDRLVCDGTEPLPFAKNIKDISFAPSTDHCVNLKQFTQLRKLDTNWRNLSKHIQLPPTLNILHGRNDAVSDWSIVMCVRLKILNVSNNSNITTCAPFAQSLVILNAYGSCGINDNGLQMCSRLKILNASNNPNITTCVPFAKTLKQLDAECDSGIGDNGLQMCHRITTLNSYDNPKITTCKPFANTLRELTTNSKCGIDDNGLQMCHSLKILNSHDDPKITMRPPLAKN